MQVCKTTYAIYEGFLTVRKKFKSSIGSRWCFSEVKSNVKVIDKIFGQLVIHAGEFVPDIELFSIIEACLNFNQINLAYLVWRARTREVLLRRADSSWAFISNSRQACRSGGSFSVMHFSEWLRALEQMENSSLYQVIYLRISNDLKVHRDISKVII